MKSLLAILPFLFASVAHAQKETPVALHKISYKHGGLPSSVARATPRGAKSCFWGKFRLKAKSALYAVHLFKANPKQGMEWEGYKGRQQFTLDFFQVLPASNYRRINRVPFNYSSYGWGFSKFGVQWFWANAHQARVPIFQFNIWTPEDAYGDIGDNVFTSFPRGLTRTATIQSLRFGTWRASDTLGEDNRVGRAKDGSAQIHVRLFPNDDVINPANYKFTLKWNGHKFLPTAPLNGVTKHYVR